MKKITLLIPCHNEEKGLEMVLKDVPHEKLKERGYSITSIVIDNNSTDNTVRIARSFGSLVIHEQSKGKGNALRTGFLAIPQDTDYVVMMDGDNTYKSQELYRLIEPLESDFADVIIGSRLSGNITDESFTFLKRAANWFYTFLVRQLYFANVTDVLSGYFAWKKSVVDDLLPYLQSDGFGIEMDMITKMIKMKYRIYSVPITYGSRVGDSKLSPVFDGFSILFVFLRNLFWFPCKKKISLTASDVCPSL
ncbi:MAG: glycosyltransferase family 2 protein [Patescibacteria group bacterium]|nr:glycosyltransferase family 2 protein [Patescibacteria group bacterium]